MAKHPNGDDLAEFFREHHLIDIALHEGESPRAQLAARIVHLSSHVSALTSAEIYAGTAQIGKFRKNIIGHTAPAAAKVEKVIAILDTQPINHLVNHESLGCFQILGAIFPEPSAVFGIDGFPVTQHLIQHLLRPVVLNVHQFLG